MLDEDVDDDDGGDDELMLNDGSTKVDNSQQ